MMAISCIQQEGQTFNYRELSRNISNENRSLFLDFVHEKCLSNVSVTKKMKTPTSTLSFNNQQGQDFEQLRDVPHHMLTS
jgi:hypothetical protein